MKSNKGGASMNRPISNIFDDAIIQKQPQTSFYKKQEYIERELNQYNKKNIEEKKVETKQYNSYQYYLEYKDNYKKSRDTKQQTPINAINELITYFKNYNYYKNNLNFDKSVNNISFSNYKTNLIKSRINDYFNIDNFFTNNLELLYNYGKKKRNYKSSISETNKSVLPFY